MKLTQSTRQAFKAEEKRILGMRRRGELSHIEAQRRIGAAREAARTAELTRLDTEAAKPFSVVEFAAMLGQRGPRASRRAKRRYTNLATRTANPFEGPDREGPLVEHLVGAPPASMAAADPQ